MGGCAWGTSCHLEIAPHGHLGKSVLATAGAPEVNRLVWHSPFRCPRAGTETAGRQEMTLRVRGCTLLNIHTHKISEVRASRGGSKTPQDLGWDPLVCALESPDSPGCPCTSSPERLGLCDVMRRRA